MIGGDKRDFKRVEPILKIVAAPKALGLFGDLGGLLGLDLLGRLGGLLFLRFLFFFGHLTYLFLETPSNLGCPSTTDFN